MQKKFLLVLSLFSSQALECAEAPKAPEGGALALISKARNSQNDSLETALDVCTETCDVAGAIYRLTSDLGALTFDSLASLSRFFTNCCITKTLSTPALELPCDQSMHDPVVKQPLALAEAATQVPTEANRLHRRISMQFHEYAFTQVFGRETYEYPDPDKILSEIRSLYEELALKFGKDSKEYKFKPAPITLEKIHISGPAASPTTTSEIITINPPKNLKKDTDRLFNFMDYGRHTPESRLQERVMTRRKTQKRQRAQSLSRSSLVVHEDTAVNPDAADINPDTEDGAAAAAVATGEDQEEMGSTFPLPTRPMGAFTIKTDPATGASVWRSVKEDPMFTHARRRRGIQAELNAVDRAFIELEARKRAAEALDDKELAAKELEAVSIAREELDVRRIHAQIDARAVTMEDARRKQIALKSARRKRIAEEQRARELADEELSLRQLAEHSKGLTFEFSQEPRAAFDRAQEARANCSDVFEASSECLTGFFEFVADKERQKESHLKAAKKPGRSTDADAADENSETED